MNRFLPTINLIGCLVLASLVVFQWKNEHQLILKHDINQQKLHETTLLLQEESQRRQGLEQDVTTLKESICALQQSFEQASAKAEQLTAEANQAQMQLEQTIAKLREWETAVNLRDARIAELNTAQQETRARLDEAIVKLRKTSQNPQSSPPGNPVKNR